MPSAPWQETWTAWQAVSLAVMQSCPIGYAPLFVPGEKSSAGPSWHDLVRRGSWHGRATCDGSKARSARQIRARPRPARPRAPAIGGPMAAPAMDEDDGGVGGESGGGCDGGGSEGGGGESGGSDGGGREGGGGEGASRVTWKPTSMTNGTAGGSSMVTPSTLLIASRDFVCKATAADST
eukprot:scaffold107992_cov45-Phaeocystis_antarctica.AAC.1